jgi:hypothetical protein
MTGMRKIGQIRAVEERLAKMGLMMAYPQHNYYDTSDVISLIPANSEALPIYSRDAEIFVGTLEDCENWLNGVDWARKYDKLLGISTESKRERKEQDRRNQNLLNTIKNSDKAKVK